MFREVCHDCLDSKIYNSIRWTLQVSTIIFKQIAKSKKKKSWKQFLRKYSDIPRVADKNVFRCFYRFDLDKLLTSYTSVVVAYSFRSSPFFDIPVPTAYFEKFHGYHLTDLIIYFFYLDEKSLPPNYIRDRYLH